MANLTNLFTKYRPNQIKDAQQFLKIYQTESGRKLIDSYIDARLPIRYQGRPLIFYLKMFQDAASMVSSELPGGMDQKYKNEYFSSKKSPDSSKSFLVKYSDDEKRLHLFSLAVNRSEQQQPLLANHLIPEEVDNINDDGARRKEIERRINEEDKKEELTLSSSKRTTEAKEEQPQSQKQETPKESSLSSESVTSAPSPTLSERLNPIIQRLKQFETPSSIKNAVSYSQRKLHGLITRFPREIIGGAAGAAAGLFWGGPPGAALGFIIGGISGRVTGNIILQRPTRPQSNLGIPDVDLSNFILPNGRVLMPIAGGSENPRELETFPDIDTPKNNNNKHSSSNLNPLSWLRIGLVGPAAVGIIFGLAGIILFFGFLGGSSSNPDNVSPSGDVTSCTFYRGGDSTPGLKFRTPEWPKLINNVSSRVGVPPSIVAGILRVECPECFYTNDPSYLENDFDDHNSFDEDTQQPVAFGATQFTPTTWLDIVNSNELKERFPEKTGFIPVWVKSRDFIDKYHGNLSNPLGNQITQKRYQDPNDPLYKQTTEDKMRIYSIKDEIIATAIKAKLDAGTNPVYNEATIRQIASSYYGGCEYSQNGQTYSYCSDLWNSYKGCKSAASSGGLLDNILQWTQTIINNFDKKSSSILLSPITNNGYTAAASNNYACTYLVIDSFNLAGFSGLDKAVHGLVVNMENFWKKSSSLGYIYLDYQQNHQVLKDVQPGFAMFQEEKPGVTTYNEHVSIVKENTVDKTTGTGHITTYDSNAGKYTGWTYSVDNWEIQNNFNPDEKITGFGGHI